MISQIKNELRLFWCITTLYVAYSLYYISTKIYNNQTTDYSFPFNIGYFITILIIHLQSIRYVINKVNNDELEYATSYFGWVFIVACITIVMICTVGGYSSTSYYSKIVDIHTLISTLSYELFVIFCIHIRICNKIDTQFQKNKFDISNKINIRLV